MTENELIWRLAGGSGDGIDSTSQNFAKVLMRSGLHVFTHRHYPSRIRGGHTYAELRSKATPVRSRGDGYNFLLALGDSFARSPDEEAYYGNEEVKPLVENLDDLRDGGIIVYDEGLIDIDDVDSVLETSLEALAAEHDWHVYPLDLRDIATDHGREVMRNTAGVGATAALISLDLDPIEALMSDSMSGDALEANLTILEAAYDQVRDEHEIDHDVVLPEGTHEEAPVLLSGSHGVAYGALDAGCRFISGYPMTPWTEVFTILSQHLPEYGGVSEQVEDEIAAAGMAIGASHAGVKAMSGSSGGGFALMSELLGTAEMTETPVVFVEAMRGGPSTGMPTKPEQGDLDHVLYSSQGDSNRIVFAPGTIEECYEQTRRAFELAYEYQLPAIVIIDQKLSGEYRTVPDSVFTESAPDPDPGTVLTEEEIEDAAHHASGSYLRFQYDTDDGVVPRTLPGQKGGRFLTTGNEHNPAGHISEDPENRRQQVDRRRAKQETIREVLDETGTHQTRYGAEDARYGILVWGSQQSTVFEAVDRLNETDNSVSALGVSEMMPFPESEVADFLESVEEAVVVEMNSDGQFRGLVQRELGAYGNRLSSLLKYDGNPFEPAEVVDGVRAVITDDPGVTPPTTRLEPTKATNSR
ncbi:2-oxoacid:acceptor oxidoreductase subunit alpha [Natrialba aegyptia]|uniref:2-oxoglutarate synthase subunit KorA n=1 Tax=Natrialba aegyptia DSM 13077 TaxID=1227491 RepID=M0AQQ6_9EURY|nr:2-oxoglutarate ferredoxin oxidoreductase subunit alpha [Natrialba aegyptia DSM 13077]